jgi:DNA invertase Pin-like site-specific DNA recombinase
LHAHFVRRERRRGQGQREAPACGIEAFAKRAGLEIVEWFYDPAVSGADPIEARPGFSALLDRLESNGVRTVVMEDASRFARDLVAQELGVLLLIKRDVRVLAANGDDLTDTADPSRVMMRQIAGSFAQFEKTRLVTKLRGARERIRETQGKCEGRKSYAERDPELVLAAKRLHRRSPKGHRRSLREIARELATMGYITSAVRRTRHRASSRWCELAKT